MYLIENIHRKIKHTRISKLYIDEEPDTAEETGELYVINDVAAITQEDAQLVIMKLESAKRPAFPTRHRSSIQRYPCLFIQKSL